MKSHRFKFHPPRPLSQCRTVFDLGKLSKQRVVLFLKVIRPWEQLLIEPFVDVSLSSLPRGKRKRSGEGRGTIFTTFVHASWEGICFHFFFCPSPLLFSFFQLEWKWPMLSQTVQSSVVLSGGLPLATKQLVVWRVSPNRIPSGTGKETLVDGTWNDGSSFWDKGSIFWEHL